MILSDNKQAIPNDKKISPTPAIALNVTGIPKVHFTMPNELKNSAISGFIAKQLTIIPTNVERITAGIKDRAVCKISCWVMEILKNFLNFTV